MLRPNRKRLFLILREMAFLLSPVIYSEVVRRDFYKTNWMGSKDYFEKPEVSSVNSERDPEICAPRYATNKFL